MLTRPLAGLTADVQGVLCQIMGIDPNLTVTARTWLPGDPPTGEQLPTILAADDTPIDRSGVFAPDGTLNDEILAGFHDLGRIHDIAIVGPCEIHRDGQVIEANLTIRQHLPDNWELITGATPVLPGADPPGTPPPRIEIDPDPGEITLHNIPRGPPGPPSRCSICGRPADGHAHGGSGTGGAYTLTDIHELREHNWAARARGDPDWAYRTDYRCCQCGRHLTASTALIGTGRGEHWCRDCANTWTQARERATREH